MNGAFATSISPILAGAAEAERDALVVSIHDVAPANIAPVRKILAELSPRGVAKTSVLVVPDYHHEGESMKNVEFVRWMRDLERDGHEVVIHGYFHERPRRSHETLRDKFLTRFYTQDEGEFHDLSYEEAFERISRARSEFAAAGLRPHGFIAPAWLLSRDAERAAADSEMEYTTRLNTVRDLRTGVDFTSRSLVYSVRNGWRRMASLGWNKALLAAMNGRPLLRLSIHPSDCEHAEVWRQIMRFVDQLAAERQATTYRDWVSEQRMRNSADQSGS